MKKRTFRQVHFAVPTDHRVRMEGSKKIYKYGSLERELKKAVKNEVDGNTNDSWSTWNGPKGMKENWKNWKSEE